MGKRRNKFIGGAGGSILSGAWGVWSLLTAVKDLPKDAGEFAKMMADPPLYAPWLLFAACVIFLGWVFWDRDDDQDDSGDITQSPATHGPNSPNIIENAGVNQISYGPNSPNLNGTFNGPVTIGNQSRSLNDPACDELKRFLLDLDGTHQWSVWVEASNPEAVQFANQILQFLRENGIQTETGIHMAMYETPRPPGILANRRNHTILVGPNE